MKKQQYLDYVKKAIVKGREDYEGATKRWRESFDADFMFGYTSPGHISSQLHMEGLIFNITGEKEYANKVKDGLLLPIKLAEIFPEEIRVQRNEYHRGVPLMEPLFQLHAYMNSYLDIKDTGLLSDEDVEIVKQSVIRSITPLTFCPEWGAHNRSMLRACALVQAAVVVGDTEETREWIKLADYLAEESMGRWSLEDAAHYIPLWLFACIMYAKWRGIEDEYYAKPQTKYYFDYVTHLITPEGQVPGFGDAWFHSDWQIWVACVEKGAAMYKCGKMKAAAEKIYDYGMRKTKNAISAGLGNYMAYAYKWSSDDVELTDINFKTEEVLDEVIGKKIIFRENESYMLYNYRDEGKYGYIPRQYLRTSIPVKAEKMHHGHGDENSITHIEKDGNILLHESGYREKLPNGKYRADLYHNKLVFREGLKDLSDGIFNVLHDDGYYKHVDTEKIHFQSFDKVDYLRTRNHYLPLELTWDRCVTWLKEDDVYIIVDWFEAGKDKDITTGNVWHTQNAVKISDNAYDTYVDTIYRGQRDKTPFENKKDLSLLVEFISGSQKTAAEAIRRNHGEATMVSECKSVSYKAGDRELFITVLTPHSRKVDADSLTGKLKIESVFNDKDAISIVYDDRINLTYKLNLKYGIHPYEDDRAPAYDWDTGKIEYGKIATDADFAFVNDKTGEYGMFNSCGIFYNGKSLFKTPRFSTRDFMVEKFKEIDHKWRCWSGTAELERK
ncbi:MAG: hypothetical protein KAH14_00080 [Clostridiales bacterium]|nr:hypothetical protein [Clostridiales bacterium]